MRGRLDLPPSKRWEQAEKLRPYEEKAAKERQREHGGTAAGKKNTPEKFAEVKADTNRATTRLATAAGYSRPTLEKLNTVLRAAQSKDKTIREIARPRQATATGRDDPDIILAPPDRAQGILGPLADMLPRDYHCQPAVTSSNPPWTIPLCAHNRRTLCAHLSAHIVRTLCAHCAHRLRG